MTYNSLTSDEAAIIEHKKTEPPFTGEYDTFFQPGTFICRRCNTPLFSAESKFSAGCGWPAFDDNFPNAVRRILDNDGYQTEIQCAHCGGHLGHVYEGEELTKKNTRHCVNSLSIKFVPEKSQLPKLADRD